MSLRKWDLQLFAEEDEGEGEAVGDLPEEQEEEVNVGEEEESTEEQYLTQKDVDRILKKKIPQLERKIARAVGANDTNELKQLAQAGRTVAQKSGLSPRAVLDKLNRTAQGQARTQAYQQGNTQEVNSELMERISNIEETLKDEREEKVKANEAKEARSEFGKLYDQYEDDIEETAEEKGLSLTEAAAIVLRPYLKDQAKQQTQAKQQNKRRRKVESSEEGPKEESKDYASKLTPEMKRTAQKFGMSYEKYYNQAVQSGLISE